MLTLRNIRRVIYHFHFHCMPVPLADLDRGGGYICTSGFGLGVVIRGGGSKSVRTPSMISMHIKLLPHFQKKDKVRKKLCETMLDFSFKAPN